MEPFWVSLHHMDNSFTYKRSVRMKHNMGSIDRALRVLAAVAIGILYITNQITGMAAIILSIIAAVFLLTSVAGFCPLYMPLKLSTIKKKDA